MALEPNGNPEAEVRIGFFVCHCGKRISSVIDVEAVAEYVRSLPNVVVSKDYKYMCSKTGQEMIANDIKEHGLNRIVVAACSPLLHEATFRTATVRGGIDPSYCHMINIRELGSWGHIDCTSATERAIAMARGATNADGLFLAGCCQAPKDITDTVAQAGAAEAMVLIDKGFVEVEPMTSFVNEEQCSGCKTCLGLCPYNAIARDDVKGVAVINAVLCKGCGICVAACPSGAITQHLFEDDEIFSEIQEVLAYA